jgi:hypothetical protein
MEILHPKTPDSSKTGGWMASEARNHYIVKHGLDAFETLPNYIWRTEPESEEIPPVGFRRVREGDRWIAYAYTTSDNRERPLSLVAGFYECVEKCRFGKLPRRAHDYGTGWMIRGKIVGRKLDDPVVIPPLERFLKKRMFHGRTITSIPKHVFETIKTYAQKHRLARHDIPGLGREPRNEQEVLAVVAASQKKIGIERVLEVRRAFPDMLVKLKGKAAPIYLELELRSSSFIAHGHKKEVYRRRFKEDDSHPAKPVGVLCWHNDDERHEVQRCVHRVYELRTLLREGRSIRW